MMDHFPSRQEKTWKQDPILCSNTSTVLGCKCTSAPSQNPPRKMRFPPGPGHFKLSTLPPTALPTDSFYSLLVIPKQKKENGETRQKRHDQIYDDAKETKPILVGEFGMITFTRHFKYLGSYISYSLKYDNDIEHRISQASAAMVALNSFWVDNTVDNFSKYLIFCAIPCNLLL